MTNPQPVNDSLFFATKSLNVKRTNLWMNVKEFIRSIRISIFPSMLPFLSDKRFYSLFNDFRTHIHSNSSIKYKRRLAYWTPRSKSTCDAFIWSKIHPTHLLKIWLKHLQNQYFACVFLCFRTSVAILFFTGRFCAKSYPSNSQVRVVKWKKTSNEYL